MTRQGELHPSAESGSTGIGWLTRPRTLWPPSWQLIRARHPSRLEELDLVLLGELAASRGRSITELVLTAIDEIPDGRTRQAARDLVPLPFTGRIAPTLTDRRTVAARSFGQSGNYFRSADRSRPSTETRVLAALAEALRTDSEYGGTPPSLVVDGPTPTLSSGEDEEVVARGSPLRLDRGAGGVAALVVGVLAVLMAVVVGASQWRRQAPSPAGEGSTDCRIELGSGNGQLEAGFRGALGKAGARVGCATDGVERFDGVAHQAVDDAQDDVEWVALRRDDGAFLAVPQPAWERFILVAEAGTGLAGLGQPSGWVPLEGRAELRLDGGYTLASEAAHGRYYLVRPEIAELWVERIDDLGAPFSSASLPNRQDFAGGYVEVGIGEPRVVLTTAADAEKALPAKEERSEVMVAQPSGVTWWIDDRDRRWWVPGDDVLACLGGSASIVADDVPGFAIARLERGGTADCSLVDG